MLNKFKYKNKVRYHFREKKKIILSWEKNDKNSNLNKNELKRDKWRNNFMLKKQHMNGLLYKSACKRFTSLQREKKEINDEKNWVYNSKVYLKKKPFIGNSLDRNHFWNNVLDVVCKKDSLYFIKNNLYHILDKNTNIYRNLNVLNFTWLFETKTFVKNKEKLENSFSMALKFFFKGFIFKGFKRICERRFLELLVLLKSELFNFNKSGFQLMLYFFERLKPLLGFRRKRLGRVNQKKKDVRYFYKLYHHNVRWQSLILKRLIFNSPFYIKRTKIVSVFDIFKGLMSSLENKGPITKGLMSYYKLIGKRTPHVKRKKKKKRKRRITK